MYTMRRSFLQKSISISFFLLVFTHFVRSQNVPIGGWKMHLPYQMCHYVTGSSTTVWTATDKGLFKLNKADMSVDRITKIEGLSDLIIGSVAYNSYNNKLVVGYKNGNLDIIDIATGSIINLPDIKNAQIIGDKSIHNIYFISNRAYLSVGFGIVVINTDRNEVMDTYMIGTNGTNLEVYDITSDGTSLFAATENGIYYAPINDPYLSNFATWSRFTQRIPNGHYNTITYFNGQLVTNWAATYPNRALNSDSVFCYNFTTTTWDTVRGWEARRNAMDITAANGALYMCDNYQIEVRTGVVDGPASAAYYLFDGNMEYLRPEQLYIDGAGTIWEADLRYGLVKMLDATHGASYYPNGPLTTDVYDMSESDGALIAVPGGHDDAWNNVFNINGVGYYKNDLWSDYSTSNTNGLDTLFDLVSCAVDPEDNSHVFMGSWGRGVAEMRNGAITNVYNTDNSTLESNIVYHWVAVAGMQFDDDDNLWMTNSHVMTCLNVRKKDGTWRAFDFTGLIPIGETVSELMVTKTGQKWMILPRGQGMLVFDDNGTIDNISDDRKVRLGFNPGTGAIPGTEVYCMAEDDDGEVWIGTDKGIGVFYCADQIMTPGACDAQQILIEQDGNIQILMETQTVTAILVDGANRKWIGTEGGGLFLMSADGTKQLAHFDETNSPLLSNDITCLSMDKKTGELFIGTSDGIVSYRGEATNGEDVMGDVYAFPNPVQHDYTGPVAITGLVKDANVKITDVRGQLVYETTALGGQAIWPGTNFKGERAASGVYLVFASNEDGTQKIVTKILFIN
ncbi:MAG TPA: two-component regulator propeller domain-containing protein [Bacteroidia bacterium]|nr:two-component regulator propeller domain-containing protein [Bacteroidia bacterium]